MAFPVSYLIVWHVAMPYLVQAFWPVDRKTVPLGRRNQAQRRLVGRRTMPLSIKIHVSTELTVQPRILTRHVINSIGRARLDGLLEARLHKLNQAVALPRIRRGAEEGLAARGGEGVAERSENEEEEEEDGSEEGGGDEIEEAPLPGVVALGGGEG